MIISLNWIKEYTDTTMPIDALKTLIGARLVEIESTTDLGQKYQGIVIARVIECKDLEGSDHLHVTKIDDSGVIPDVERDENGYVQVVCGAPNVTAGQMIVWLPPRTIVPNTFEDAEPFVLEARKLRGAMSNGMIASARELDLYDEHVGILALDVDAIAGTPFADVYGLNDYVFDIENKSLTHRPDTFGIIGFAREVAAVQGKGFTTPAWLMTAANTSLEASNDELSVAIDDPELSARYQAVVIKGIDGSKVSSLQIQSKLARIGMRPISAVVDVTNYLMMLTGQPLHAFDYDKLKQLNNGKIDIHVRGGREDETLELIDGRTIQLAPEDIVIANGETAIALAGAMGGSATEIDDSTTSIVLESATFNLYNLRTTQMRHGIFSEAITRFTKGQPAALTAPVLAEAIRMLEEYSQLSVSSMVESYPHPLAQTTITLTSEWINQLLGTKFSADDIVEILANAEFESVVKDQQIAVTAPYWRADIHIPEDIAEEVGRLSGFDSIEQALPTRSFTAIRPAGLDQLRSRVRDILVTAGSNEVLSYSFVHGNILTKANQKPADSYRITNSISPDLQYYRQTLTPSLLSLVHPNIKQGFDIFSLFEINKSHPKEHGLTDEGVPAEVEMIALVTTCKKSPQGAAFYQAKKILEFLGTSLGLELVFVPVESEPGYAVTAPFEFRRSAFVSDKASGTFIGIVGEYKALVRNNFKAPDYTAGFEIDAEGLLTAVEALGPDYTPMSRFPSTERDLCFQVTTSTAYGAVVACVETALSETSLEFSCKPLDIYQAEDSVTKNVTLRIRLTSHDKTLTGDETAAVIDEVVRKVSDTLGAILI